MFVNVGCNRLGRGWVSTFEDPPPKEDEKPKLLTQEEFNAALAKEKRNWQQSNVKVVEELEALKQRASLTEEERTQLDERVKQLNETLLTKDELSARQVKKLEEEKKKAVDELNKDRDRWRGLYTTTSIENEIISAATQNKAVSPKQIIAILKPLSELVEKVDSEGKPTGTYEPRIKMTEGDKTLNLTVSEAVKRMTEETEFLNLFQSDGTGGTGRKTPDGKKSDGTIDWGALAKSNPKEYQRLRSEGKSPY